MRSLAIVIAAAMLCSTAVASDVIVTHGPVVISAQDHATIIARRGTLGHSRCSQIEGIGSGRTPEEARRNCCYFGRRVIVDEGVAWSPVARRWFAVIRYR